MLLKIDKVSKIYGEGDNSVIALDNISLDFNAGEFVAVMGSSGSGKTTLLNCISSIDKPTKGNIYFDERNLLKMNDDELSEYRAKHISFIFQNYNLITNLSVYENIILPLQILGKSIKENQNNIEKVMEELGISKLKSKFPNQLSGGQQQRVAIARAIANSTDILIADEPTGALDSSNSENLMKLFKDLNTKLGLSIFMVTHDPLAAKFSSKVIYLSDGKVIDILMKYKNESEYEFLEKIIEKQKSIDEGVI